MPVEHPLRRQLHSFVTRTCTEVQQCGLAVLRCDDAPAAVPQALLQPRLRPPRSATRASAGRSPSASRATPSTHARREHLPALLLHLLLTGPCQLGRPFVQPFVVDLRG
jgi:hypothetical protein